MIMMTEWAVDFVQKKFDIAKLACRAAVVVVCVLLILFAGAYYLRVESEHAVNDYVTATYGQECSIEYVGGYLPDDTRTYSVRLCGAEEPVFLVVVQGKDVVQDTYLPEYLSKEIVQNWADDICEIWGAAKVWLWLESTDLSRLPLPDMADDSLTDVLQYAQSSLYIQPAERLEETVVEERLLKTAEVLASWSASIDLDAAWIEPNVCMCAADGAEGFYIGTSGKIKSFQVPAGVVRAIESKGLELPVTQ